MRQRGIFSHWSVGIVMLLSALVAYVVANDRLGRLPRTGSEPEFSVRLPVLAQVLMAAGDRYLAADLDGFRVLVADTGRMSADDYAIQAGLQRDISFLNPAHEDNYYIAAAILSWGGQVEATQYVLRRAADARPYDYLPLFHYGFNLYHFYKDPAAGAAALLEAVPHASDVQDQIALKNLAAIWTERGYSLGEAAGRVEAMANASPPGGFRRYLLVRASRLRTLENLRSLARKYEQQTGHTLAVIDDLVRSGMIERIPADPLRVGFAVDAKGEPVFADVRGARR